MMKFRLMLLLVSVVYVSLLSAETTLNPTRELHNGADIIVPESGQWQADLSNASAVWEDFYQIIGRVSPNPEDHVPDGEEEFWADVRWTSDPLPEPEEQDPATWLRLTPPTVQLGMLPASQKGCVIYHFVAPHRKIFADGTVDGVFGFAGNPSANNQGEDCWFGVGPTLVTNEYSVTNVEDFTLIRPIDEYPTTGWTELPYYFEMNWSLPVPADVNEFYVVVSENYLNDYSSGKFGYNSLSLNVTYIDLLDGDINEDFYVNIEDLSMLITDWMECTDPAESSCLP